MRADPHDLLQGQRLARKRLAVDLVKGDDGAFWHSGQEQLQCLLRRFVQVEVKVEQGDDGVRIGCEVLRGGLGEVAFDQFDIRDVCQVTLAVVLLD